VIRKTRMWVSQTYLLISLFSLAFAIILFLSRSVWLPRLSRVDDDLDMDIDLPPSGRIGSRFLAKLQRYVRIPGSFQNDLDEGML